VTPCDGSPLSERSDGPQSYPRYDVGVVMSLALETPERMP